MKRAEEVWGAHADIGLALALAVALPLLRALLDWLVFKVTARLSQRLAARAPLGSIWAGARPADCARHHSLAVPVLPLRAAPPASHGETSMRAATPATACAGTGAAGAWPAPAAHPFKVAGIGIATRWRACFHVPPPPPPPPAGATLA